jgi:dTDP-4-dehydrorhamnose reductase
MRYLPKQQLEIWGGLECTINRVQESYFDQQTWSGHRERPGDISLFTALGIKKMRYPILWEQHQPSQDAPIDWAITEQKINELRRSGVEVIAGLVHHGSGPAYALIQDAEFAPALATYAARVAEKFPWIKYYTPVNEPLTTARFCGLYGHWYPHETNDISFCRILLNECKATILAMEAIRLINPDAQLVQTDDLAKVHSSAALSYQAAFENQRRWLSFDLICGSVNQEHPLWDYLVTNNISVEELNFFLQHPCPPQVLGINYYLTSERYLDPCTESYPVHTHGGNGRHAYADVEAVRVGTIKPDGIQQLLKEAWKRYGIPIAITEVHLHCTREEQMRWLNDSWLDANALRKEGIPVLAITPWAMLGSYGWNRLLTAPGGSYESGIFDCRSGQPRPTVLAEMIKAFSRDVAFDHPALDHPGWWARPCRVIYGEKKRLHPGHSQGRSIAVSGPRYDLVAKICRERWLKTVETANSFLNDCPIWATIVTDEFMEISCPGRDDLVISLQGDPYNAINSGLDLLLDGESGYWESDQDGKLCKRISQASPV